MGSIITFVASCVGAGILGWLSGFVLRLLARRRPFLRTADDRCRTPWIATLMTAAALSAVPAVRAHGDAENALRHGLLVALIVSVTWLCIRIARTVEDATMRGLRMDIEDNRRIRKLRTQVSVMRRLIVAVLVVLAAAVVLMTFSTMRTFGASLLASAGVAGIIGGLAAQSTLGNVFAGLQLAFNDSLRVDDVIVVEDEWGKVEDLTLTYVVLHLWDERRLVLPTTYFTTQPFQNWTRSSAKILGTVLFYLDYRTPVDRMRAEAERIIAESPLWDRGAWVLQVSDVTEATMQVRVLATAKDAPTSYDLRCEIREKLLVWLAENHPESLPTTRLSTVAGDDLTAELRKLVSSANGR